MSKRYSFDSLLAFGCLPTLGDLMLDLSTQIPAESFFPYDDAVVLESTSEPLGVISYKNI